MLNSYASNTIKINAITGAILKNHPKSWFERFHLNSSRANELLTEGGHRGEIERRGGCTWSYHNPEKDIVVLQMVICGDMEVIAECVRAIDLMPKEEGAESE